MGFQNNYIRIKQGPLHVNIDAETRMLASVSIVLPQENINKTDVFQTSLEGIFVVNWLGYNCVPSPNKKKWSGERTESRRHHLKQCWMLHHHNEYKAPQIVQGFIHNPEPFAESFWDFTVVPA